MPIKLLNAFSLNMITAGDNIQTWPLTIDECRSLLEKHGVHSCIGHEDTANVVSSVLEIPVAFNRVSVKLELKELAVVAQYKGPRLPEGTKTLPEGATIELVAVYNGDQPDHHFCTGDHVLHVMRDRPTRWY